MNRVLALLVASAVLLCTGCRAELAVSDRAVVTALGIDTAAGENLRLSVQAIAPLNTAGNLAEQTAAATAVYTAAGATVSEALQAFLNETGKRTYLLQNQLIAVSESQCRSRSLFATLDYFLTNRDSRALVELAVCRGNPTDLLTVATDSDAIPATHVANLLAEGRRRGQAVSACLLDVCRASAGLYDAALPLLEVTDGTPRLVGTALFAAGRWAGELTVDETIGLSLAAGTATQCLFTEGGITARLDRLSVRWTWPTATDPHFAVAVSGRVTVLETGTARPLTATQTQELIGRLQSTVACTVETALQHTVIDCGSDPLGLARRSGTSLQNAVFAATVTLRLA